MNCHGAQLGPSGLTGQAGHPKVLLVGNALGGGGAENRFRLMAAHMFGGDVHAAVLQARDGPVELKHPLIDLCWSGTATYPRTISRLRAILSEGQYDVAVSAALYPNAVLWAATRGLSNRPALVMTEITRPFTESTKFVASPLVRAIRQWLYRASYRSADLVAANSEDGRLEIARHYGPPLRDIVRIPNIVDVEKVEAKAKEETAFAPQRPSFCVIARLDPIKRVDTLLEATALLPREMDWQVDIVGEGTDRAKIEAQVRRHDLADRVTLHGWQANPYPFIRQARATILCSEYEGFSNSVLESMILRVPVITSFCSSDAEDMVMRGAALGFQVGDVITLARHLESLLTDSALLVRLVEDASQYSRQYHLAEAVSDYESLVIRALERPFTGRMYVL